MVFIFYVKFIEKFKHSFKFSIIPFSFEQRGSEIIFNDQKNNDRINYSATNKILKNILCIF